MKQEARLLISGDVQGVGYRFFVRNTAIQFHLNGWVRNNYNGTVECEVEGEKETIERFMEKLKTGHPWAHVDSIEVTWEKYNGKYSNFFIE